MKEQVMPKVLKEMGLSRDTKVVWSSTAGCYCGCSPGFIVKDNAGMESKEVFVDVRIVK
jgi:Ni,Fe-hydrogenase I small subunit